MNFEKMLRKLKVLDISFIKLGMIAFTLWLVALLPAFANWVQSISHWWFLAIFIVLIVRPFYTFYIKK